MSFNRKNMLNTEEKSKKISWATLSRVIKMMFSFYPIMMPIVIFYILLNAVINSIPSVFMQKAIALVEKSWQAGDWTAVSASVFSLVGILASFYGLSLLTSISYTQMMAVVTQGTLKKLREKMFDRMQNLPIRYFDTHHHGDIMSHYTNDIDALRQMISESFPHLLFSSLAVSIIFVIMLYFCLWLTLLVLAGTILMLILTKKIGSGSARYFFRQQAALGKVEGFAEEMLHGQKVIKVFCHEQAAQESFDALNEALFQQSQAANKYANMLGPLLNNIGNILYVFVALVGGVLLSLKVPNVSLSGMALSISMVVPFLNMAKQFTGNINQVSHQVNAIVLGLAGSARLFQLMDEEPETDAGYVTLVNVKDVNGVLTECPDETGLWAWKHPHQSDGTVTYTRLEGDVRLQNVDFAYQKGKTVLHEVSLYAKPGQKVAFVGATGAGKTTITNLLNRFYDIEDGKIRYDGININKIKKADLRRSLGMILQDTNLFSGTVMENIRYGKLTASDEECIAAARLSGADDFISRLPKGYETLISGNGANLSQGQRQLLSIARAAVANPPVMIMDEATSSIDTRTEAIVQHGMDALMRGRTVFVIAHRLSTVKNSSVIMVLDHGRIIERGTHQELLAAKGQYYQLYTGAFELE
jgi:ATP-binding cassette, subfamily B, multidrug efflux pump